MKISVSFSGLAQTTALEFAGVIGIRFGPVIGGLFLAFPSILPAAATLVEKHEAKKKEQTGRKGKKRGRTAAGADAAGAALGSFGLLVFGFVVWELSTSYDRGIVLCTASLAWFSVALFCWLIRKQL